MLTTAGPFCSTSALKSGSARAVAEAGAAGTVWACDAEMGENLSASYPRVAAAANAASVRANIFLDMRSSTGIRIRVLGSAALAKFRRGARRHILLRPAWLRPAGAGLVLGGRLRLDGLLPRKLLGARLLQDVGALRGADAQGELDRRIAVLADPVDVGAVPEQEIDHLGVSPGRGVHERRVAVVRDQVGVEVL